MLSSLLGGWRCSQGAALHALLLLWLPLFTVHTVQKMPKVRGTRSGFAAHVRCFLPPSSLIGLFSQAHMIFFKKALLSFREYKTLCTHRKNYVESLASALRFIGFFLILSIVDRFLYYILIVVNLFSTVSSLPH